MTRPTREIPARTNTEVPTTCIVLHPKMVNPAIIAVNYAAASLLEVLTLYYQSKEKPSAEEIINLSSYIYSFRTFLSSSIRVYPLMAGYTGEGRGLRHRTCQDLGR